MFPPHLNKIRGGPPIYLYRQRVLCTAIFVKYGGGFCHLATQVERDASLAEGGGGAPDVNSRENVSSSLGFFPRTNIFLYASNITINAALSPAIFSILPKQRYMFKTAPLQKPDTGSRDRLVEQGRTTNN